MADLLGEVDTNVLSRRTPLPIKLVKNESRRKVRVLSPPLYEDRKDSLHMNRGMAHPGQLLNTPPLESKCRPGDDDFFGTVDDEDMMMSDPLPSSPVAKAVERKGHVSVKVELEDEDDDMMEVSPAVGDYNVTTTSVNISGSRPVPKTIKKPPYPSPDSSSPTRPPADAVDPSAWNDVNSKLNVLSSPASQTVGPGKLRMQDAMEEDGSLRMFWTDYTEVNGSLCLFGKVKDKSTGLYVSAFIKVENILRKLFFLPRVHKQCECPQSFEREATNVIASTRTRHFRRGRDAGCVSGSRRTHDRASSWNAQNQALVKEVCFRASKHT